MKHVLFVVLPERGHIHPFLGAAAELRRRGARVSFYSPRDVRSILAPLGHDDVHAPEGATPPPAEHRGAAFAELLGDPARLRAWIRTMLVDSTEPAIGPLRSHLARTRPDVVVIDPMAYFGAIAAHEEKLPWLGLSTSLNPCIRDDVASELIMTIRSLDDARHALFRAHGLSRPRFRVSDVLSPHGTFVLSTPALVGPPLPEDGAPLHLVGAALPPEAFGEDAPREVDLPVEARPLVYVSFGSQAYYQPERLRRVFAAAALCRARFVVAAPELASSPLARSAPANVSVVPFAAQVALLREARVFVTHGGANSVHEGLASGVPLLVSPICNDQHHNAALVVSRGAGRELNLTAAAPEALSAALDALSAPDAPERREAEAIARSYRAAGGASRIADVVWSAG